MSTSNLRDAQGKEDATKQSQQEISKTERNRKIENHQLKVYDTIINFSNGNNPI